jgi:hypoxanthine phosphoribosyltransferase
MKDAPDKLKVTWAEVHAGCRLIAEYLSASVKPDYHWVELYGIVRGGMIPTVLISHILDGFDVKNDIVSLQYVDMYLADKPIVLVDEICDTGSTFCRLREQYPDAVTVSLFTRYDSKFQPDYSPFVAEDDRWLVFPWETE